MVDTGDLKSPAHTLGVLVRIQPAAPRKIALKASLFGDYVAQPTTNQRFYVSHGERSEFYVTKKNLIHLPVYALCICHRE